MLGAFFSFLKWTAIEHEGRERSVPGPHYALCRLLHNDLVHGDAPELAQGIQVIHAGQITPMLPVVDRLRMFEPQIGLQVLY